MSITVSVQTILASVQSLVTGIKQLNAATRHLQNLPTPQHRFVIVMQVNHRASPILSIFMTPSLSHLSFK